MNLLKNILIVLLVVGQVFTIHSFAYSKSKIDMAIVSLGVEERDPLFEDLVRGVSNDLKIRGINVVSPENVEKVLGYHDRKSSSLFSKRIRRLLAESKKQYYQFNYIEAKSIVKKIISDIERNAELLFDNGSSLLDAYLTLGIIFKSIGNIGEARQAFTQALRLNPDYNLDSRAFPPSLMREFEKAREFVAILPRGKIKVYSNLKVADVYINGINRGVTPLILENLPEGKYQIEVTANKYSSSRKSLYLKAGKTVRVKERLKWLGERFFAKNSGPESLNTPLDEALKIAEVLRVDKVVLLDFDSKGLSEKKVRARVVDAKYKTGLKPINISISSQDLLKNSTIKSLSQKIASQAGINIASNPYKYSEPIGSGDVVLLSKKRQSKISKPILFSIIGGVLAAGLGAGLATAFSGGSSGGETPTTGNISVSFR